MMREIFFGKNIGQGYVIVERILLTNSKDKLRFVFFGRSQSFFTFIKKTIL